jgi:hypothetical protein
MDITKVLNAYMMFRKYKLAFLELLWTWIYWIIAPFCKEYPNKVRALNEELDEKKYIIEAVTSNKFFVGVDITNFFLALIYMKGVLDEYVVRLANVQEFTITFTSDDESVYHDRVNYDNRDSSIKINGIETLGNMFYFSR